MAVGWVKVDGSWYYMDGSGAMQTGWINDNGTWYYTGPNGVMATGWLEEGGAHYYLRGDGSMATGWREMDGAWYYFDGSGRMATGITQVTAFTIIWIRPPAHGGGHGFRHRRGQLSGGQPGRPDPDFLRGIRAGRPAGNAGCDSDAGRLSGGAFEKG